jgi:Cu(I)/Ag(I) efflux system membrane fusion protein
VACVFFLSATAVGASEFDQAMQPVLAEYLKIHGALAADKTDGIQSAAQAIEKSAKELEPDKVSGDHAEHYKNIPADLVAACKALEQSEDLVSARDAFKLLSQPVSMWVGMSKPEEMSVMYCPMAEAGWVQEGDEVANPYYGSAMLGCGEKVGGSD